MRISLILLVVLGLVLSYEARSPIRNRYKIKINGGAGGIKGASKLINTVIRTNSKIMALERQALKQGNKCLCKNELKLHRRTLRRIANTMSKNNMNLIKFRIYWNYIIKLLKLMKVKYGSGLPNMPDWNAGGGIQIHPGGKRPTVIGGSTKQHFVFHGGKRFTIYIRRSKPYVFINGRWYRYKKGFKFPKIKSWIVYGGRRFRIIWRNGRI